jgi:hypothetical protein
MVPYNDVRFLPERYTVSVVSSCGFSVQKCPPTADIQEFCGEFPPPVAGCYCAFEESNWVNFPQLLLTPSNSESQLINCIVSYKDADEEYDSLYMKHDEQMSSCDVSTKFEKRPLVQLRIFECDAPGKRYVQCVHKNWIATSYYSSRCHSSICALLEPGKSYSLSICLRGDHTEASALPYRVQIKSNDVCCSLLEPSLEYFPFSKIFKYLPASSPESKISALLMMRYADSDSKESPSTINQHKLQLFLSWDKNHPFPEGSVKVKNHKNAELGALCSSYSCGKDAQCFEVAIDLSSKITMRSPNFMELLKLEVCNCDDADRIIFVHGFSTMPLLVESEVGNAIWSSHDLLNNGCDTTKRFTNVATSPLVSPMLSPSTMQTFVNSGKMVSVGGLSKETVMVDIQFLQRLYDKISELNNFVISVGKNDRPSWLNDTIIALNNVIDVKPFENHWKNLSPIRICKIFVAITKATGAGAGLFTDEEIEGCGKASETTHDQRSYFVSKLILYAETVAQEPFSPPILVHEIHTGCNAENTAKLLRSLATNANNLSRCKWAVETLNGSAGGSGARAVRQLAPSKILPRSTTQPL